MKISNSLLALAISALLNVGTAKTQNKELIVKLADPEKAGKLNVELFVGSIKIVGYSGKDVLVVGDGPYLPGKAEQKPVRDTTKKLSDFVSQENNLVKIKVEKFYILNLVIKVPLNFSLILKTQTQGNIDLQNVNGYHEISVISGNITLTNIGGSILANNTKGDIKVDPGSRKLTGPIALSSVMGTINLSLPANQNANVRLQTDFAEIHSDFDIVAGTTNPQVKSMAHRANGKMNGGGPEIYLKSVGGSVFLKKGK